MKPVIYRIDFPDGNFYVGATTDFSGRRKHHLQRNRPAANKKLAEQFQKHHTACVYQVASLLPGQPLLELESMYIQQERPTLNTWLTQCKRLDGRTALSSVLRRYNVDQVLYIHRRKTGWTLHEALNLKPRTPPKRPKVKQRIIEVGGRSMPLKAWAKLAGVSPGVIHSRLGNGWTEAQAVGVEPPPSSEKRQRAATKRAEKAARPPKPTYTVRGFTGTIPEIARHFNLTHQLVYGRRKLGWDPDDWAAPLTERDPATDRMSAIRDALAPYM